jgi:hypothetical protein
MVWFLLTFWSGLVLTEQQMDKSSKFKELLDAADVLSVNEKAELAKKLLNSPGLGLVFVNNPSVSLIGQINSASRETLSDMLAAIAQRIAMEGS